MVVPSMVQIHCPRSQAGRKEVVASQQRMVSSPQIELGTQQMIPGLNREQLGVGVGAKELFVKLQPAMGAQTPPRSAQVSPVG